MKPSKSLSSAIANASSGDLPTTLAPEVRDLTASLDRRRLFREVTLSLRSGLRDLSADFSFLRVRGLRSLLESLNYFASNDAAINMFRHSQGTAELQVVPVLFQNSLQLQKGDPGVKLEDIFGVEPMKVNSPASNSEISLALRVLEGCCLLHPESLALAHKHKAVKVLLNIISTGDVLVQGSCLDALISVMLDSSPNQMDFENASGMKKIAELMKDERLEENTSFEKKAGFLDKIGILPYSASVKAGTELGYAESHCSGRMLAPWFKSQRRQNYVAIDFIPFLAKALSGVIIMR